MNAYEVSTLVVASFGVVAAVLALPRATQVWLLPSVVGLLLLLILLPVKALEHYRVWIITGVLSAVALAVLSVLLVRWLRDRPPRPISLFDIDSLVDGARVEEQDLPMTITGRYSGKATAIRVVLQDGSERYYLQHPEVTLGSGSRWSAAKVRPGHGISRVLFVQVGSVGKKLFDAMVDNHSWGAFPRLPSNSCVVASLQIDRQ
jgi:hypothetical protein